MIELLLVIGVVVAFVLIFVFASRDSYLLLIMSSMLLIACVFGLEVIDQRQVQAKETVLYNHGTHAIDNGKWDLYPVGHKINTTYVYRCDKCGYSWESDFLYY